MSHFFYQDKPIETPALILNEQKMKQNLKRVMGVQEKNNVKVRPHFKTHKSISIAKLQLTMGACGITVATVTEGELLLENGIDDILVAFPLTDSNKIKRLFKWTKIARVIFTVDSMEQSELMMNEAKKWGLNPEVWIKVNSGLNRCGVEPNNEVLELAKFIKKENVLNLTGIYTHAGHSYAAKTKEEIRQIAKEEALSVLNSVDLCEKEGISLPNRSVGSTPTFEAAATYSGITEVRPGNAVFFDAIQVGLGVAKADEVALTVLSTVVSRKSNRLIIDAGSKALTTEKGAHGNEVVKGYGRSLVDGEFFITRVSEEHGIIDSTEINNIQLNEKLQIIPNHACPVVNLYDFYYVQRENGQIERWLVDGRGKSQ
ncbi:alanine racemase [Evansella tamaricis]|uniref:Alanine racemase n=1 Tax=Evansella tamaricis TaxID=2069301 RepID=A0ABS6JM06_9BACI|nr:alanine racemase [Evansella tamaricis]MBU9714249.1 alanine racemase [Evansella tamaricis]